MNKEFHHIEDIFGKSHFVKWDLDEDNVRHLFGEEWANNHPGKFRMLDHTVEILKAMEDEAVEWEPENQNRVWAAIQKKMDHGTVSAPHGQRLISAASSYKSSSQFSGLKVLAILAMVIVGALGWLHLEETYADKATTAPVAWVVKSAKEGEKKRVHLPDGTTVILNAASEIRYKEDFGQTNRDIWMEGESYFEVAKDTLLPFMVHSGDLTTEALGTAFTVKAYQEEDEVNVKLLEGKVKVLRQGVAAKDNAALYLAPGQAAFFTGDELKKNPFEANKALLWTEGTLFFDHKPFEEVVRELERWYGVDITFQGAVAHDQKVSGEFRQDHLDNVLKSLSYSFGFAYHIEHKKVSIQFKEYRNT